MRYLRPPEDSSGAAGRAVREREHFSAWAEEARRRFDGIRAGRRRTIGNDEAFARLRARFDEPPGPA